jgi:hypothetical protein
MSNGEYKMPQIGDIVAVSHNSNGTAQAVTMGTVWNQSNVPAEGYKGLYRKEYGEETGQAYERYDSNTGVYTQFTPKQTGRTCNGDIIDQAEGMANITAKEEVQVRSTDESASIQAQESVGINAGKTIVLEAGKGISLEVNGAAITISEDGDVSITSPTKIELSAPEVNVTGTNGNVTVSGVSLVAHTHGDSTSPNR